MTMLKRLSVALVALMLLLPWTAGAQTTTIEFWSFIDPAGASVRSKTLAYIIETFEKANPGIKVKTTIVQWDQISSQLLPRRQGGRGPRRRDALLAEHPGEPAGREPDGARQVPLGLARGGPQGHHHAQRREEGRQGVRPAVGAARAGYGLQREGTARAGTCRCPAPWTSWRPRRRR